MVVKTEQPFHVRRARSLVISTGGRWQVHSLLIATLTQLSNRWYTHPALCPGGAHSMFQAPKAAITESL